jgi:hypothetical protein
MFTLMAMALQWEYVCAKARDIPVPSAMNLLQEKGCMKIRSPPYCFLPDHLVIIS